MNHFDTNSGPNCKNILHTKWTHFHQVFIWLVTFWNSKLATFQTPPLYKINPKLNWNQTSFIIAVCRCRVHSKHGKTNLIPFAKKKQIKFARFIEMLGLKYDPVFGRNYTYFPESGNLYDHTPYSTYSSSYPYTYYDWPLRYRSWYPYRYYYRHLDYIPSRYLTKAYRVSKLKQNKT